MFRENSCSSEFCNIRSKIPVLESLFSKVADLQACNFIKKRLRQMYFPVNIEKFLRTPSLKNICERLLLKIVRSIFLCVIMMSLCALLLKAATGSCSVKKVFLGVFSSKHWRSPEYYNLSFRKELFCWKCRYTDKNEIFLLVLDFHWEDKLRESFQKLALW